MKIHQRIKSIRAVKGWSQEEIAEKLHMSLNAYGCIERGETCPNLNRLEQIAQIFGVGLGELVSEKNIFNVGSNSSNVNNSCYDSFLSEHSKLQHELEKLRLLLEQKDKEIECLKQQNVDLRKMVNLLKPENKSL